MCHCPLLTCAMCRKGLVQCVGRGLCNESLSLAYLWLTCAICSKGLVQCVPCLRVQAWVWVKLLHPALRSCVAWSNAWKTPLLLLQHGLHACLSPHRAHIRISNPLPTLLHQALSSQSCKVSFFVCHTEWKGWIKMLHRSTLWMQTKKALAVA